MALPDKLPAGGLAVCIAPRTRRGKEQGARTTTATTTASGKNHYRTQRRNETKHNAPPMGLSRCNVRCASEAYEPLRAATRQDCRASATTNGALKVPLFTQASGATRCP